MNDRAAQRNPVDGQVGARIQARRLELQLAQRDFPGVSYTYLSRVENGQRRPSLATLVALADRLEVTPLYLATGDERAPCPFCHRTPNHRGGKA